MGVDVRRGGEVAVSQPLLNVFERHAVGQQQAGAAMPEIVIPDLPHPLRLEQLRKALCDVVRLDQIANLIDTYILKIFLDVLYW